MRMDMPLARRRNLQGKSAAVPAPQGDSNGKGYGSGSARDGCGTRPSAAAGEGEGGELTLMQRLIWKRMLKTGPSPAASASAVAAAPAPEIPIYQPSPQHQLGGPCGQMIAEGNTAAGGAAGPLPNPSLQHVSPPVPMRLAARAPRQEQPHQHQQQIHLQLQRRRYSVRGLQSPRETVYDEAFSKVSAMAAAATGAAGPGAAAGPAAWGATSPATGAAAARSASAARAREQAGPGPPHRASAPSAVVCSGTAAAAGPGREGLSPHPRRQLRQQPGSTSSPTAAAAGAAVVLRREIDECGAGDCGGRRWPWLAEERRDAEGRLPGEPPAGGPKRSADVTERGEGRGAAREAPVGIGAAHSRGAGGEYGEAFQRLQHFPTAIRNLLLRAVHRGRLFPEGGGGGPGRAVPWSRCRGAC